jgi:hypothetical protein
MKGMNCYIVAIVLSILAGKLDAQNWLWAKAPAETGDYTSVGKSTATDASGNVYVLGEFGGSTGSFSVGAPTLTPAPGGNLFLVKYDPAGNIQWARSPNADSSHPTGTGISIDGNGNIYIVGVFSGAKIQFGTVALTNTVGSQNAFIAKYNASGTPVWANCLTGGANAALGVNVDKTGKICVCGTFSSPSISAGAITMTNIGGAFDLYVLRYDTNGNCIWGKNWGGGGSTTNINGIYTDAACNIYFAGSSTSPSITFGSTTLVMPVPAAKYALIVKLDSAGIVQWAKQGTASSTVEVLGISGTSNGDIFVCGIFLYCPTLTFGSVSLNAPTVNDFAPFILKMDANGNPLWLRGATGGRASVNGFAVAADILGNVYGTGYFDRPLIFGATTLVPYSTSNNPFVVKYDPSGNFLWAVCTGGPNEDKSNAICTDLSGNAYVTGNFESHAIIFGLDTVRTPTVSDMFICKISGTVAGIESLTKRAYGSQVLPNPFKNSALIRSTEQIAGSVDFILYDQQGREVRKEKQITQPDFVFERGNLSPGLYFYSLMDAHQNTVGRGKLIMD